MTLAPGTDAPTGGTATAAAGVAASADGPDVPDHPGAFARLGAWAATHFRRVLVAWLLVLVVFGFFAIHVENALAGATPAVTVAPGVTGPAIVPFAKMGVGAPPRTVSLKMP